MLQKIGCGNFYGSRGSLVVIPVPINECRYQQEKKQYPGIGKFDIKIIFQHQLTGLFVDKLMWPRSLKAGIPVLYLQQEEDISQTLLHRPAGETGNNYSP